MIVGGSRVSPAWGFVDTDEKPLRVERVLERTSGVLALVTYPSSPPTRHQRCAGSGDLPQDPNNP